MSNLSERLIELQAQTGLLKKEIAENIGISVMGYYRYECGDRQPTAVILPHKQHTSRHPPHVIQPRQCTHHRGGSTFIVR